MLCLPFTAPGHLPAACEAVRAVVDRHGVVALPTETFYGLAVSPFDDEAVARVFAAKGRPAEKALLVVAGTVEQLDDLVGWPGDWRARLASVWPAPLTVVLPAHSPVAASAAATLAVRVPAHDLLRQLLARVGPLTATSANRSGCPALRSAAAVRADLHAHVDLLLDGGDTAGGLPSTVLDASVRPFAVVRRGAFGVPDGWS